MLTNRPSTMETNQDLHDPEKTFSQAPTVSPSHSSTECECDCHQDPPRMWLLYTSFILILVALILTVTGMVIIIVSHSRHTTTTTTTNPTTTVTATVTAPSAPTITPHAGRRSTNPYTTCLLGPTQDDMTNFMGVTNPRVYFGQTCAQVEQEGLMPYEYNYVYEIAVAPPASKKRGEGIKAGTEMLEKRRELSSSPESVNDGFSGKEHAHWHPKNEEQRKEIEAGEKETPPWVEWVQWVRAVGWEREAGQREE